MLQTLGDFIVEAAMIVATVTAAAIFIGMTWTLTVRWVRHARAERLAMEPAIRRTPSSQADLSGRSA